MNQRQEFDEQRVLRWQCRRGMRELDVLLSTWLEAHWDSASEDQRRAFRRLLEQEDDLLLSWLLGRSVPPEPDLRMIVEVLREGTDT